MSGCRPSWRRGCSRGLRPMPLWCAFQELLPTCRGQRFPRHVAWPSVVGVSGDPLAESERGATQDFLLVDSPAFGHADAKSFLASVRRLMAATDRCSCPHHRATVTTHVLGETFYSQVPLRYGDHIAKLSLAPVSAGVRGLRGTPLDPGAGADALLAAVRQHFARQGGTWELRVQLCTDLARMPIEDASVPWPEGLSPYRAVATLTAAPQPAWTEARERSIEHAMSFSPWNALAAHRPLGGLMRVRQAVYAAAALARQELCSEHDDQSHLLRQLHSSGPYRPS